ncbi:hypothetical protein LINPERPRIM_LOCUS24880 [Linum perenne]
MLLVYSWFCNRPAVYKLGLYLTFAASIIVIVFLSLRAHAMLRQLETGQAPPGVSPPVDTPAAPPEISGLEAATTSPRAPRSPRRQHWTVSTRGARGSEDCGHHSDVGPRLLRASPPGGGDSPRGGRMHGEVSLSAALGLYLTFAASIIVIVFLSLRAHAMLRQPKTGRAPPGVSPPINTATALAEISSLEAVATSPGAARSPRRQHWTVSSGGLTATPQDVQLLFDLSAGSCGISSGFHPLFVHPGGGPCWGGAFPGSPGPLLPRHHGEIPLPVGGSGGDDNDGSGSGCGSNNLVYDFYY